MTSVSKNVYIEKLDEIIHINTINIYNSTIKMKRVNVISNAYIDSSKEINKNDSKLKIGNIVRISKHKIFLQKLTLQIGLKIYL